MRKVSALAGERKFIIPFELTIVSIEDTANGSGARSVCSILAQILHAKNDLTITKLISKSNDKCRCIWAAIRVSLKKCDCDDGLDG